MHSAPYLPRLSAYEPVSFSEGSVDPLGLQNAAERLADLLLPGFTVRVERARCLTMATLAVELAHDPAMTAEGQDPQHAMLAVERLCVYALARQVAKTTHPIIRGFPGRLKALRAVQNRQPLTPSNYVKGPATNGLVGVHFRTCRTAGLFDSDFNVLSRGHELLRAWKRESGKEVWDDLKPRLIRNLQSNLRGEYRVKWDGFDDLAAICRLDKIRVQERRILDEALNDANAGLQSSTLSRLQIADRTSINGSRKFDVEQDAVDYQRRGVIERAIIEQISKEPASRVAFGAALQAVARTIMAYERVAQITTTAFDLLRHFAFGSRGRSFTLAEVANHRTVSKKLQTCSRRLRPAVKQLQATFSALAEVDMPSGGALQTLDTLRDELMPQLSSIDAQLSELKLLERLTARHLHVQAHKSKQPWLVRDGQDHYRFFPDYLLAELPRRNGSFLFAYRIVNALSVLDDLRVLS